MKTEKYYVDSQGNFIGIFGGYESKDGYVFADPPKDSIEVDSIPTHGNQKWIDGVWIEQPEQIIARLERCLDMHLDNIAKGYRYESIRTMVTYATSEHPDFGREGKAAVKFRDAVYAHGIKALQDVQAGLRPIPTESELVAELPLITEFFPAA